MFFVKLIEQQFCMAAVLTEFFFGEVGPEQQQMGN